MISTNIDVNSEGRLTFAGQDTTALAAKYGTPLYLMDEDRIRANCRMYKEAMKRAFGGASRPLYAGKAACFKQMYVIMAEEGLDVDLVSIGEIYTAYKAGYPMERAYFHSNNKTEADIAAAMDWGVGCFVADNTEELDLISAAAQARGARQKVLLRLTPGIDPHTYEAVATGKVDSKFGVALETGQGAAFVEQALGLPGVEVAGYHCHVGSQVFDSENSVYTDTAAIMLAFAAEMKARFGYEAAELNMGGGYGVRYVESDPQVNIPENIRALGAMMTAKAAELGIALPAILMEPGRSIVADAGMTLYTVGAVKRIPGYKNYVSVDGGMTDNPRYALYGSQYTLFAADRAEAERTLRCDVVGRCCESGDVIQPDVTLPEVGHGDILAVCTTGAYNYSMASNYNRLQRPPVVMLRGGEDYVAVRRETLDDIVLCDL